MDAHTFAVFRYARDYVLASSLTHNIYLLRWIFERVDDEATVNAIYRVCKFWRRNANFANPTQRFVESTKPRCARSIWSFSGASIRRTISVLQNACTLGVYAAVDALIDEPALRADAARVAHGLLTMAVQHRHLWVVRRLLRSTLNIPDTAVCAAFEIACRARNSNDLALELLALPALAQSFYNIGLFERLCETGQYYLVKQILQRCKTGPLFVSMTSVVSAIESECYAVVDLLLSYKYALYNDVDNTALATAARNNAPHVVRRILAQPRATLRNWPHIMFAAAVRGHIDVLDELLSPHLASIEALGELAAAEQCRIVFGAACCDRVHVVARLLDVPKVRNTLRAWLRRRVSRYYVVEDVVRQRTVFHHSNFKRTNTDRDFLSIMTGFLMLDQHAETISSAHVPDLLTVAAVTGATRVVALLLGAAYADVVSRAAESQPLVLACTFRRWDVVELLLRDARSNLGVGNQRVLIDAIEDGRGDIVRTLLADRSGAVNPCARFGLPLQTACRLGHEWIVEQLLACRSVRPEAQKNQCLAIAIARRHTGIALRLARDARVVNVAYDNNHLLRAACELDSVELVEALLVKRGAIASANANAPLRAAVTERRYDVVRALLRCKAPGRVFDPSFDNNYVLHTLMFSPHCAGALELLRVLLADARCQFDAATYTTLLNRCVDAEWLAGIDCLIDDGRHRYVVTPTTYAPAMFETAFAYRRCAALRHLMARSDIFSLDVMVQAARSVRSGDVEESLMVMLGDARVRAALDLTQLALDYARAIYPKFRRWLFTQADFDPTARDYALLNVAAENGDWHLLRLFAGHTRVDWTHRRVEAALHAAMRRHQLQPAAVLGHAMYAHAVATDNEALRNIGVLPQALLKPLGISETVNDPAWVYVNESDARADVIEIDSDGDEEDTRSEELVVPEPPVIARTEPANKRRKM